MATAAQLRIFNATKTICVGLGIPTATIAHKQLKGSVSSQTTTGNRVYTAPGPITSWEQQYESTYETYWVSMTFIRGFQREEDEPFGVESIPLTTGQVPVLDVNLQPIVLAQDDFILDPIMPYIYRVVNPVLSPDGSFWGFITEKQR